MYKSLAFLTQYWQIIHLDPTSYPNTHQSPQVYILLCCPRGWSSNSDVASKVSLGGSEWRKVWMSLQVRDQQKLLNMFFFLEAQWSWGFWSFLFARNIETLTYGHPCMMSKSTLQGTNIPHRWKQNDNLSWATTERAVFHLGRFSQYSAHCVKTFLNDSNQLCPSSSQEWPLQQSLLY